MSNDMWLHGWKQLPGWCTYSAGISPTLFSRFNNCFALEIRNKYYTVQAGTRRCSISLYADDIALITETTEEIQTVLNTIASWDDNDFITWDKTLVDKNAHGNWMTLLENSKTHKKLYKYIFLSLTPTNSWQQDIYCTPSHDIYIHIYTMIFYVMQYMSSLYKINWYTYVLFAIEIEWNSVE